MVISLPQEFVSHECDTSELGPSRFATTDVHRIGILDVRLYNTDRCASPKVHGHRFSSIIITCTISIPRRADSLLVLTLMA